MSVEGLSFELPQPFSDYKLHTESSPTVITDGLNRFSSEYEALALKAPHLDIPNIRLRIIYALSEYRCLAEPETYPFDISGFFVDPRIDADGADQIKNYVYRNFVDQTIKPHHKSHLLKRVSNEEDRPTWSAIYSILEREALENCNSFVVKEREKQRIAQQKTQLLFQSQVNLVEPERTYSNTTAADLSNYFVKNGLLVQ